MSANCQQALDGVGMGVANALRAVDCTATAMTGQAFGRLFASGGVMAPVLTILLTMFVAIYAIMLLLGRTNLSIRALLPRMITVGLVITFATSWVAYNAVVWNLAIGAPDQLASILTGTSGSATITFADKIDVVFLAIQEVSQGAGGADGQGITAFSPAGLLWMGALLFLLGTVGILVTARIALALLIALGPVFVVMALFNGTRGLFTGWVKGVTMLALTPLFAVLGGSVMLELSVPILSALTQSPGQIDPQAAMAFFLVGAVHVALMVMVLKVAGTMVSGWRVFGLVPDPAADKGRDMAGGTATPAPAAMQQSAQPTLQQSAGQPRRAPVTGATTAIAANDTGGTATHATNRETRIYTASGNGQIAPLNPATSRTRGIGNRFRSASPRTTEKLK
jgi:type IV secretion system protein VirB6